jgi:predicted transcriptional regulator
MKLCNRLLRKREIPMNETDGETRRWSTRFDPDTEIKLRRIAEACEWSLGDVVRRACALYLEGEGKHILEFQEGMDQIARGETEDFEDVIAELEAIVEEHSEIEQGDPAQTETERLMIQIYREHAEIGDYDPAEDERLAAEGPWLHLTYRSGANQVRAAWILKEHGIPLKFAHIALTEMIDNGSAKLAVSGIQDFEKLQRELEEVGIFAEKFDVE